MDYSTRLAHPKKHWLGLTAVVAFHVAVIYALTTVLSKKVVDVVGRRIETKIIEEEQQPLPPAKALLLPPPVMEVPPPPFIPPPEVRIAVPTPEPETIKLSAPPPAPAPVATMRPAPPLTPPVAKPVAGIGTICPTMVTPTMPRRALREGITGTVKARATIRGGTVTDVKILSASPRGVFDSAVRSAMLQYRCAGDHIAEQEFVFTLN